MSRNQEIALVREMIGATEKKLSEGNSDKLYLEAELKLLREEHKELICPRTKLKRIAIEKRGGLELCD